MDVAQREASDLARVRAMTRRERDATRQRSPRRSSVHGAACRTGSTPTARGAAWATRAWRRARVTRRTTPRPRPSSGRAPPFVKTAPAALRRHGARMRVFFMDEARFGQQGTLTRVWARRGSRPAAVKQTRYEWVHLYAAVEPVTGESVALQAPHVNTGTFNVFLEMLAKERGSREHAILNMDRAAKTPCTRPFRRVDTPLLGLPDGRAIGTGR